MAHYVNNAEFLAALVEHRKNVQKAAEEGTQKPQIPNYIGDCILKIANHLAYKPNFINYSYKDDMILDGIENCIQYLDNFNPDKSSNPFAYFTQIIYYAFLRRITKEKKQSYIKGKLIQDMPFEAFELQEGDDGEYHNQYLEFMQQHGTFDDSFIQRKAAKKKKKQPSLDEFIEGDNGSIIGTDDTGTSEVSTS
jgi:hypothetical protein